MNLAYRCFHAIPDLSRSDGFPTNALRGWVRSLWRVQDVYQPTLTVVVFDSGEDSARLELLPDYKQQRSSMPEALAQQLPCLKEFSHLSGMTTMELAEVEADDVIATLAKRFSAENQDVLMLTADKDLAQCVNDRITMLVPVPTAKVKSGFQELDPRGVEDKFGVPPSQIAHLLALTGDASDNIPGLAGVGLKTASKWLRQYGDVDGVIRHAGSLKPDRFRGQVAEKHQDLLLNLKLTNLRSDLTLPAIEPGKADPQGLAAFLKAMEMNGILQEAAKRFPS